MRGKQKHLKNQQKWNKSKSIPQLLAIIRCLYLVIRNEILKFIADSKLTSYICMDFITFEFIDVEKW